MNGLCLHVPELNEFWYRKKLMEDPETMSYNRGYDLDFAGYDKETGCIAFPKTEWESRYNYLVGDEPEREAKYVSEVLTSIKFSNGGDNRFIKCEIGCEDDVMAFVIGGVL